MQDLIQETARGIAIAHDTYSSAHTNEWVNMENHAKITYTVLTGGTATAGVKLKIQCAINKSGSSAADVAAPFDGGVYYKHTTTTVPTKTSASSSSSVAMVVVGTSTSAVYYATVDASVLAATKPYVSIVAKDNAASSLDCAATFEAWGTRYQQEAMLDVLA
jgi:hypothetical protein